MKIEKVKSKLKKVFNRVMGVLLPVATLFVSCGTNALVVHAAESSYTVKLHCEYDAESVRYRLKYDLIVNVPAGWELVGSLREEIDNYYAISLYMVKSNTVKQISDVIGDYYVDREQEIYKSGDITYGREKNKSYFPYKGNHKGFFENVNFTILSGNMKVFKDRDEINKYVANGAGDYDIIKPDELEKGWYLKNVSYKVTADDSPSSEAGADATYIHFSWDTDNLQEGDLLEIKTKSYYKKILGEQLSGFHDFITKSDGVSAYEGKYSFSQYEATKAWFNSLENKPIVFKEYDTTDYYLRPYRQGQYGGWVHIKMGRSTPTSSPYIEDIEYGDFDDDNNWTVDEDLTDKNGGHHGVDQGGGYIPPDQSDNPFTGTNIAGIFSYFYDFMKQIPAMLGDLPALVGNIISFLPKPIIAFIGIGVIVAIILRIVGR